MTVLRRSKMSNLINGIGQSILSLSLNIGAILSGALLLLFLDVFSITPWAFLLFPGVLSIRGAIGGLFCGRLSTALHIGTVRASYTKNTRAFYLLLSTIITLTLGSSLLMGVTTTLFSTVILDTSLADFFVILAVLITTMGMSLALISPITLGISILSYKKRLDPDVIVYPIISSVADIIVTICYLLVLTSFFSSQLGRILIGLFDLLFICAIGYLVIKNYREADFVKTVKEFLFPLVLVAFIVNITGLTLNTISQELGANPKIFIVYPALITTVGAVGSIVGSTVTTKLALGLLKPSFESIKQHLMEIGSTWLGSLVMFTLYGSIAAWTQGLGSLSEFGRLIIRLLLTNLLAIPIIVAISFTVAILTQKRGLDPDNFVIPIESSLADSITTFFLLLSLIAIT